MGERRSTGRAVEGVAEGWAINLMEVWDVSV
jgi:hypothetical protein